MEVGGSDSGMEPTPDSSLTSERELGDGTSSESSAASGRRGRPPRTPLARSVSVRSPALRTPDDGRWPSNTRRNIMSVSVTGSAPERNNPDKYATLPRRRRKSAENLAKSREPSLNRTASLRRKKAEEDKNKTPTGIKKTRARTKIYHEVGCQTGLTGADIEATTSARVRDPVNRVELVTVGVQSEGRLDEFEKLEKEHKDLEERAKRLTEEKSSLSEELSKEKEERQQMEKSIRSILGLGGEDELIKSIEKDKKKVTDIVKKQNLEINQLHTLCCNLKKELERCALREERLLEDQKESEAESLEIQEFLQAEKSTLAETLKELEVELAQTKVALTTAESELVKQQEECTHLVRMCEQRRQEKLSLESRLRTLEMRSKETMLEQGAAVSGAAVALSGLGSRLDILVSNLVSTYNISSADLENYVQTEKSNYISMVPTNSYLQCRVQDVVYHNEAFNESDSSGDLSPEVEEKKSGGLLAAIISAIKSATHRSTPGGTDTFSESELLASESEPVFCDKRSSLASLPDISPLKSHRDSIAASDDFDLSEDGPLTNSDSIQNLSDAIIRRQREEEESNFICGQKSHATQGGGIIDQVIEVDNMVTRLLRVLHIIEAKRQNIKYIRENGEKEVKNINETMDTLKNEIKELKLKLQQTEKSSLQVESLQKELKEREKQLNESEKKFELAQELLTNNWHKAMSEVRRLYEAIDSALELMQGAGDEVERSAVLSKVRRELEETNFRCSTTLPVSTSRPDLNANAALPLNVA
ncbi:uncharacterized protein corn [Halyomorpha halys]|uniref:uncharacterized protein corn n=1 Tax=Halyomorpha halys TaxID=286706 RepID=UPI0034D3358A